MSFKARTSVAFVAALLALATLSGALAQAQIGGQSIIVNPRPGDLQVFVSVDRDPTGRGNPTYNIGDSIAVNVSVNRDAYVYVFSVRSDGVVNLILPNGFTENPLRLRGGQSLTFPRPGDQFSLSVAGPPGVDRVLALASLQPLSIDDLARVRSGEIATANVQGADSLARALAIIVDPIPSDRWATATATFTVAGLVPVPPRPLPIQGTLSIDSSPRGAQVFVDNVLRGVTPLRLDLAPGRVEVALRLAGYEEYTEVVNIRPGQTSTVSASLRQIARDGTLSVDSTPRGAQILVNGALRGVTPARIDLQPGSYELRVRLSGYEEFVSTVNIRAGSTTSVNARLTAIVRPGTLSVGSSPSRAQVFVDGVLLGVTPLRVDAEPGQRQVQVSLAGYEDFVTTVTVRSGQTTSVNAQLQPVIRSGTLSVDSSPRGAQVYVNGILRGVTPLRVDLDPAQYDVRVRLTGYEEFAASVNVRSGQVSSVNAQLQPVPRTGTLQVVANVAGAEVWLDNSRIGVAPLNTTLNEGAYLVGVRAAGFEEFQIRVTIQVGRVTRVDANLRALAGSLRVIGAPEGAYVFIDGAAVGRVAGGVLEVGGVAAGQRELTVIAPGYRTSITQVNVAADRRLDVRVSLTPL
jgi:hypothetical protein